MSRAELIIYAGQMVALAPAASFTDTDLLRLIEDRNFGSVILFKRNCSDIDELRQLISAMQRRAKTRLMVMIDQEGGRVMRIKERRYTLPSARELADMQVKEVGEQVRLLGLRLKELGINVNLAPVLDVDSNPENPIIGDRSFGSDIDTVYKYAKAYWMGLKASGVIACGKHFPGHGDTHTDSHLTLPIVKHDLNRIHSLELMPFKQAIADKIEMLMVAHVVYEAIDPEEPATLSKAVSTELLQNQLSFKGVIMADDLEMKAVADRYSTVELVYKMVMAGMDILPVCKSYELADDVHRAIIKLVVDKRIPLARIKNSYDKIMNLKQKYGLLEDRD